MYLNGHIEEALKLSLRAHDIHSSAREDVRRTHQHGISHLVAERLQQKYYVTSSLRPDTQ